MGHYCLNIFYALCGLLMICMVAASPTTNQEVSEPPMPASLAGAVCGPQMPGMQRPGNWADLKSLNPCPLNECCSSYGQCGNTPEFCTSSVSTSSVQGTSLSPKSSTSTVFIRVPVTGNPIPWMQLVAAASKHSTQSSVSKSTSTGDSTSSKHSTSTSTTDSTKTTQSMTKTTSTTTSATSDTWLIRIYSKENWKGAYYVVQGHNEHVTNECLNLHGRLSGLFDGDKPSCRWFPDDGSAGWEACDKSSLKSPQSWSVESGTCTVYDNDTCKSDGYGQVYSSWDKKGCENMKDSKWNPKTWAALECSIHS
ncbi:hypothetical protein PoHVEF18_006310 [Penicillium ochrochloron]